MTKAASKVVTVTTFAVGDIVKLKSGGPRLTVLQSAEKFTEVAHFVDDVLQNSTIETAALALDTVLELPVVDPSKLPSRFQIGDMVQGARVPDHPHGLHPQPVQAVQFSEGKVHYLLTDPNKHPCWADSCDVTPA